jgi:predicted nucleotidyltransferase
LAWGRIFHREDAKDEKGVRTTIDIPPIEQIVETIAETPHPDRIVLFGSRARGDARPDSEVDLLVEMESSLPPRARAVQVDALFATRD